MDTEPLVLLHGFSATADVWEPVLPMLAERHDIHALTLAGHCGGAPLADGVAASVAALADGVERDMDAAGLQTAHLCGNSLGGWLALELACRGRARSVVAIAPAGGWEQATRDERRLGRMFRRNHRGLPLIVPRADRLMRRPGLRRLLLRDVCAHPERLTPKQAAGMLTGAGDCAIYLDLLEAIMRDGPPKAFDGISSPVRIVWGSRDRIIPVERYSQRLRDLVPDADFVVLDGLGHCPMVDDPALVSRSILEVTARRPQAVGAGA